MSLISNEKCLLLGFPESYQQARELAELVGISYADIQIHRFPDGESKITLPVDAIKLCTHVLIYRSLDHPNEKLVELLLSTEGVKNFGVKKQTLIAPYLSYMRQDKAFNPGEVISQTVIGRILADHFDAVITVDSHLHRIQHLSQAIPINQAINLTATQPMSTFLQKQVDKPFIVGPDAESQQWVEAIALPHNWDYAIANKQRNGDRDVTIQLPLAHYKDRNIVLVDDVASSGQTLIQTARQLKQHQPKSMSVLVTHAFFEDDSLQQLRQGGVTDIWSCNSVKHATNAVSLTHLLANTLKA